MMQDTPHVQAKMGLGELYQLPPPEGFTEPAYELITDLFDVGGIAYLELVPRGTISNVLYCQYLPDLAVPKVLSELYRKARSQSEDLTYLACRLVETPSEISRPIGTIQLMYILGSTIDESLYNM